MEQIKIYLETQMRAGTHYLLSNLVKVYCYSPAVYTLNKEIEIKSFEWLNKGLHNPFQCSDLKSKKIILQSHYYNSYATKINETIPTIYLIGYPLDSFISDAVNYNKYNNFNASPSCNNYNSNHYNFTKTSEEFKKLEQYMLKNAEWLNNLIFNKEDLIIRYEDFYINFDNTIDKIKKHCGFFEGKFDKPVKNEKRVYWSQKYEQFLSEEVYDYLLKLFDKSLHYFWPERN